MSFQEKGTPVAMGVVKRFGQGNDDLVRVPIGALHVEKAFGARAAGLVDDDEGLIHQVVLLNNTLNHARHLVGAPARACGHDEFNGLGRFPGVCRKGCKGSCYCERGRRLA